MDDARHPFRREPKVSPPRARTRWVVRLLAVPLERITRRQVRWPPSPTLVGFVHLVVLCLELTTISSVLSWERMIPSLKLRLWILIGVMTLLVLHLPIAEITRRRGFVWNGRGCELGIWTGVMLALALATLNLFSRITISI
jgi:hypothetical protein